MISGSRNFAPARPAVQAKPAGECQQHRPGEFADPMPAHFRFAGRFSCRRQAPDAIHALRIQVHLIPALCRQPFDQLRHGSLCSMPPVHEWRNHRDTQLVRLPANASNNNVCASGMHDYSALAIRCCYPSMDLRNMPTQTVTTASVPSSDARFTFRHIPELDGFRGLAVLVVVAGHYLEFRLPHRNPYFATLDKLGVLLFFVLSGFLITGLLDRERSATTKISFGNFYIRRALRLALALLLFLATVVILIRLGSITDVSRIEILECLFYVRNFFGRSLSLGHIWSLSLEEQFYLLWPWVFSLLPLRRSAGTVTCICLGIAGWRATAIALDLFSYQRGIFYMRPYFRFDSILIGACLVLWLSSSSRAVASLTRLLERIPSLLLWAALLAWTMFAEDYTRPVYLSVQELLVVAAL